MKKVVSIALFGEGEKLEHYAQYLPAFVLAHLNLFPRSEDWTLRVHVANDLAEHYWGRFTKSLDALGIIECRWLKKEPLTKAMLWRMAPVFDPDVTYTFCRDVDAAPLPRDRAVCDQFIASGCYASTVHDNLHHVGIMGGLCGFQSQALREVMGWKKLEDIYDAAAETEASWQTHGTDQTVLNRFIPTNPAMKLLEHRFSGWHAGPGVHPLRGAGHYACRAWSTPIPDMGVSRLSLELTTQADRLANHMGAAGYDFKAARAFWEEHGDPDAAGLLKHCEEGLRG